MIYRAWNAGWEWKENKLVEHHLVAFLQKSFKVKDGKDNATAADVESFAAIYIGGGNTFKLLNDFRRTGFDHVLLHFIERGGIVYGGSAGAIIFGKDIMTASSLDSNDVGLQDTAGLDLVHGCSVWCHYHERDDLKIIAYIERYQHPVIALSERTGLFVKDDMMQPTGFEPVTVFERQRRVAFPPASPVTISES